MKTLNLQFRHVADNQNDKEVIFNDTSNNFDTCLTGDATITVNNTNVAYISDDTFTKNNLFIIEPDGGSPPTSQIKILVPPIKRGLFAVRNNTAEEVVVRLLGQLFTDRVVEAGESAHFYSNGELALTPHGAVSVSGSVGTAGWSKIYSENLINEFDSSFSLAFRSDTPQPSIDFMLPSGISAVKIIGRIIPENDGDDLHLYLSKDAGATYEQTGTKYGTSIIAIDDTGTDGADFGSVNGNRIPLAEDMGASISESCSLSLEIFNYADASQYTKVMTKSAWLDTDGSFNRARGGGVYRLQNVINAARITCSTGNIASFKIMIIAIPNKL